MREILKNNETNDIHLLMRQLVQTSSSTSEFYSNLEQEKTKLGM